MNVRGLPKERGSLYGHEKRISYNSTKNLVKYQRCSPDYWRATRNSLKRKLDCYCLANEGIDSAYYMQFSDHILKYNIEL